MSDSSSGTPAKPKLGIKPQQTISSLYQGTISGQYVAEVLVL